ncbi:unnamed protein product [Rhodiola kirilowii]
MTVEEEEEEGQAVLKGKKVIVVGVQIDSHGRELLNWAIVKVAEPGDHVVAVYVCRNSDAASKDKSLLDGLVGAYDELCNIKQVNLSSRISLGRSIKKGVVTEAKAFCATAVIVGITISGALGQGTSAARYCAKHLPLTTEVMAINNGKVAYRSISSKQLSGLNGDGKPSLHLSKNSDISESEIRSESRWSNNLPALCKGDMIESRSFSRRLKRVSVRQSSQCTGDPLEQIPGWPLLRTNSVITLPKATSTRKISVVQWVMSLPDRSPPLTPQSSNESGSPLGSESVDSVSNYGDQSDRGKFSWRRSGLHKELGHLLDTNFSHLHLFSYEILSNATSQFSSANLIGKGGCNYVYKGVLPDGKPVAVKVMMSSKEACKDFMQEVEIVSALSHKNIVSLIGVCIEDSNLISVYDLLPKGSLEDNLVDSKAQSSLTWEVRFNVAVGVCEALSYLHSQCSRPVVHRDVKSSNILLSDTLEPQLSDFGLAIWGPEKSTFLTRADVVGTFGYLAPEYFMYGKVSEKVDVYSFGVVLLELLSGRRPICSESPKAQESLVMWARPLINNGDLNGLLVPNLRGRADEAQLKRMVAAATLCLTRSARLRPKMTEVLKLIRGELAPKSKFLKLEAQAQEDLANSDDNWDDEVYPESCAESHLNLAFLDVAEDSTSLSSNDRSNRLSVEEYLKGRWSRSSSIETS